ncbi:MAG: MarR family transcriptional regulator [Candidatus Acidiferrum sp.]|jgi:DNA-binding MarR family transcriptional regulator
MNGGVKTEQYRALAELRYRIRQFLGEGDAAARASGLEPQQYLLLLMIRGLPAGQEATIRTLAERLALKHHSVVELIDRLEGHGYVRRTRGREDRRRVLVSILPRGEKLLEDVARQRIDELRSNGHDLVRAIDQLLDREVPARNGGSRRGRQNKKGKQKKRG